MNYFGGLAAAAFALCVPQALVAAPVDLSSWLANGGGTWMVSGDNNSVSQSINGAPTVFHNNTNSQGTALSGTIKVETSNDDDFIGFVLGYTDGDIDGTNSGIDYLLFDWKQSLQSGWGPGMAISRVTGDLGDDSQSTDQPAWQHTGIVEFLTRSNAPGSVFGNTGWSDNTEYTFEILFTANRVKIDVNGTTEFDIFASDFGGVPFADGAFGFYNFSQERVRYAGIASEDIPDDFDEGTVVPLPATAWLMLAGLGGLGLVRRRRAS